ncbi:hypothetical protein PHLCEN_2v13455 [Hermanssonia centrifuga]|uniref:Transposase n=1 Tax=Hermanssonia centrifuga TaxID=98765 RepID=A0A2R6NE45_9APHY|nr:hypothetical protein PHLCEN_2v13455 [Hermanssonia centrifuga]
MSGSWSWKQADILSQDQNNDGAMIVPLIFGSNKTTVSVATGQNDYYPLYMSSDAITNAYRRAHCDSVVPLAFLATPKSGRKYDKDPIFQKFHWQLFHKSLAFIMQSLKPGMTTKQLALLAGIVSGWCPKCLALKKNLDNGTHGRRTRELTDLFIEAYDPTTLHTKYGIHADIIPFTNNFPRADIHELIAPDLLHQIIKGTFKDHLVTWVGEYLTIKHGETAGNTILDDIDHRIAAAPPFPGLRRFPEGRCFKQWTGDNSKALMKVYLSAIAGHVPDEMVQAIAAFLEFCYFVRRPVINQKTLHKIEDALTHFHTHRKIFETTGVCTSLSLPRQHSLKHYIWAIQQFGAPNGLCTSITESRHITAVKEPWRRSNRYKALGQMLTINQRLHKLGAACDDFKERGITAFKGLVGRFDYERVPEPCHCQTCDGKLQPRYIVRSHRRKTKPRVESSEEEDQNLAVARLKEKKHKNKNKRRTIPGSPSHDLSELPPIAQPLETQESLIVPPSNITPEPIHEDHVTPLLLTDECDGPSGPGPFVPLPSPVTRESVQDSPLPQNLPSDAANTPNGTAHTYNPTFLEQLDAAMAAHTPEHHIAGDAPISTSPTVLPHDTASGLVFERAPSAHAVVEQSTPTPFWRVIMLLAAWLHLRHFVLHRAIGLMLQVFRAVLISIGAMAAQQDAPVTLRTTFNQLGLGDNFHILPMCPACHRVYPYDSQLDASCTNCHINLFIVGGVRLTIPSQAPGIHTKKSSKPSKLLLQAPYRLPSEMLPDLINSTPHMEAQLDTWRTRQSTNGTLKSIQDGHIWKTIKGYDDDPFFANTVNCKTPDELRIGVTLGFDGYLPQNLLLCGLTPGPKELTGEELQYFMKLFVDDLLMLYDHGIVAQTNAYPEGRRVRVTLIAVCCDHPALCRLCGFADHGTNGYFCPRCTIRQEYLHTPDGVKIGGFPLRDGNTHRNQAQDYANLGDDTKAKDAFFKEHSMRYFELSCLPYFDPVEMTVIDPMHNILLGVVKTQWYGTWIQGKTLRERTSTNKVRRELDSIHDYLKIIPLIWEEWSEAAEAEYHKKTKLWQKEEAKRLKRIEKGKRKADGTEETPRPKPRRRMHPRDADNFLSLAAALKILLARSIEIADLDRAQELLQDFLDGFMEARLDAMITQFPC